MFITNTIKVKSVSVIAILALSALIASSGCGRNEASGKAQKSARASRKYYRESIKQYEGLISKGKDLQRLNYELGMLYFEHGEYERAGRNFKDSGLPEAKKYLAIALYKSGDFTEAHNLFKQIAEPDAQTRFFSGLTAEKLNLFDEALKNYRGVKDEPFKTSALELVQAITQESGRLTLADLPGNVRDIVRGAPGAENYPNAGALILSVDEAFDVAPDNTAVQSLHYIIKILNERGKEKYSEMAVEYDSTDEKVELEYARTIKPDGTVVTVGTRHIRDVSKYLNFPLYSNARVMIISFPEVTQGAVLEYKLKVFSSELINKNDFVIPYTVQENEPIMRGRFLLTVPEATEPRINILNPQYNYYAAALEPIVFKKGHLRQYLWEFKDIPQIIPEPNMPPAVEVSPVFVISTFKTWQEIYEWWWNLAKNKIEADDAIKAKTAELTSEKKSLREKIRAIYDFCARDIRYVAVEYGQAGYEPHQAKDIFSNKYGDCKDQAILLVTMLKVIGANAYPVLIPTRGMIDLQKDFPSSYFNHCIAAVECDGVNVFMDPTASTCPFSDLPAGDQQRNVLIFTDKGYKIDETPLLPAGHNKLIQKLDIQIGRDETLLAKREVLSFGQYDQMQRAWLTYTAPEQISQGLEEKIQDFASGARLIKYATANVLELSSPVRLEYSFSGQEYWTKAGTLRILPQLCDIDTSIAGLKERRYPVDLGLPEIRITEYDIKLPAGVKVKYLPENVSRENPWLKVTVRYAQKNGAISVKQETSTKKIRIAPEEYLEFKDFLEDVTRQIKQRVILEKAR
ncbi:MAG: DUF3857 domain-containing protein [Candidatus Omnitrophica bacterium]|nr:DUF3857 domain-containing protein [Candidatus Omnitrophota bacterium]